MGERLEIVPCTEEDTSSSDAYTDSKSGSWRGKYQTDSDASQKHAESAMINVQKLVTGRGQIFPYKTGTDCVR